VNLHPKLAEALFQAGKVYMALGEPDNALPLLGKAIDVDKCYALKAAADGDFQRHEADLRVFLETLRQEKLRHIRREIDATMKKYEFWLARSEAARQDPLIGKARLIVRSGLPLWDLLAAQEELASLPRILAERSVQFRFLERVEEPGPAYEIEEKKTEAAPQGAGFFRRLAGPKERTRIVRKSWAQEHIVIHDATGAALTKIDFSPIPPGRVNLWRRAAVGGEYVRRLKITKAFVLSTTPVTVSQYEALLPQPQPRSVDSALPAVNVSWTDAVSYCI
jgi:tetratricopeptide (TPR) repeat protein